MTEIAEPQGDKLAAILEHLEGVLAELRAFKEQEHQDRLAAIEGYVLNQQERADEVAPAEPEKCAARYGWLNELVEGTAQTCLLPKGHGGSHQYANPEVTEAQIINVRGAIIDRAVGQSWVDGDEDGTRWATSTAEVVLEAVIGHIARLHRDAERYTSEPNGRDGFLAALDILREELEDESPAPSRAPLKDMEPPGTWPMSSQWGPS